MAISACSSLIGACEIKRGLPHVGNYQNIVYKPVTPQGAGYDPVLDWGLYTQDGKIVPEGAYRRGPSGTLVGQSELLSPDQLRATECIADECIYLGPLYGHYGHHIVTSIARAWFALNRPNGRFVFHSYLDFDEMFSKDFVRQTFEAIGIGRANIVIPTRPTLFKRMIVPAPSFQELSFAHDVHAKLCRSIGARLSPHRQPRSGDPIFLSKRNLTSGVWRFANENEMMVEIERQGINIVDPERLTFPEQINLFNLHKSVSGVAGSGFHTSMFARHPNNGVGLYF